MRKTCEYCKKGMRGDGSMHPACADKANAREMLNRFINPGDTVYTNLRHVSRSGMMRSISMHVVHEGEMIDVGGYAGILMDYTRDNQNGLRVGGCGMDMGYHLVYNLARTLYGNSFPCTGKRDCPSNDHRNPGDREIRKGKAHSDGGYALNHRWI